VDVLAAQEDLLEHVLAGDVGEHAQLDLRVVDGDQHVAGLGDEAGRISRRSPSGSGCSAGSG
jgi:hypothetical protein